MTMRNSAFQWQQTEYYAFMFSFIIHPLESQSVTGWQQLRSPLTQPQNPHGEDDRARVPQKTMTKFFKNCFRFIFLLKFCLGAWTDVHVCADCTKVQKRYQIFLELELQAVGSCLIQVLGTEVQSPKRAEHSLNRWAISPEPKSTFNVFLRMKAEWECD